MMNKTWLVAKETYRREVKNWSFLLMIFAPFIVLVISFFFGMSSSSAFDDNTKVGIVSQNENLLQPLKKKLKRHIKLEILTAILLLKIILLN